MINILLKEVQKGKNLTQTELAEVMGCSIDRVKGLTSSRVKNLTHAEAQQLVLQLGVRPNWLVSGDGPMLESVKKRGKKPCHMSSKAEIVGVHFDRLLSSLARNGASEDEQAAFLVKVLAAMDSLT